MIQKDAEIECDSSPHFLSLEMLPCYRILERFEGNTRMIKYDRKKERIGKVRKFTSFFTYFAVQDMPIYAILCQDKEKTGNG